MAGNKKATIRKLKGLRNRLLLLGIVLAIIIACMVFLNYRMQSAQERVMPTETMPYEPDGFGVALETPQDVSEITDIMEDNEPKTETSSETSNADADNDQASPEKQAEAAAGTDETANEVTDSAKKDTEATDIMEDNEPKTEAGSEISNVDTEINQVSPEKQAEAAAGTGGLANGVTDSPVKDNETNNQTPSGLPLTPPVVPPVPSIVLPQAPETDTSESGEVNDPAEQAAEANGGPQPGEPEEPTALPENDPAVAPPPDPTDPSQTSEPAQPGSSEPEPEITTEETCGDIETTIATGEAFTEGPDEPDETDSEEKHLNRWVIAIILSSVLLAADLIGLAIVQMRLSKAVDVDDVPTTKKPDETTSKAVWHPEQPEIGKIHGIGARSYQQDSLGHTPVLEGSGILAMVADGMGGLSNGDQVSQQIIMGGLNYGAAMTYGRETNPLVGMVGRINADINRMLGPDLIYKCGSTFIAVLSIKDRFHWISVGDSRIYLYRAGFVNQLNTDHDLMQLWMPEILAGSRSYAVAAQDPEGRKLTSFIGMGDLKYVDYSRQAVRLQPGDRLVLMTDGVYGAVPPETLAAILKANTRVSDAAKVLERAVLEAGLYHQDNYTAMILGF